jgi:hypothetical protein
MRPDPASPPPPSYELTLQELYQIIGELEVVRRKQAEQIQRLTTAAEARASLGPDLPTH